MSKGNGLELTRRAVSAFLEALGSERFDIGVANERGMMPGHQELTPEQVMSRLPLLRSFNARGNHIYVRPAGESQLSLLDDLTARSVARLEGEGFAPAAVIETSTGNFQAWLKYEHVLSDEFASCAARMLAERFGADLNAAGRKRFGRLPGFTNRKPKYANTAGLFPFVTLHERGGQVFAEAKSFLQRVEQQIAAERGSETSTSPDLSPRRGGRYSCLSLPRFRALPQYAGQPARADCAFARAALSLGMPAETLGAILALHYLSRNPDTARREAYIKRTLDRVSMRP